MVIDEMEEDPEREQGRRLSGGVTIPVAGSFESGILFLLD